MSSSSLSQPTPSTLSPTKHRTLSRQPSSPSLAVGLPPPLPESGIMKPSTSSSSLSNPSGKMTRTKSRKRIHRGDVSSSAASSENEREDQFGEEGDDKRDQEVTPKRKVVNPLETLPSSSSTGASKKSKKITLQERLAAAAASNKSASGSKSDAGGLKAKVKSSKSIVQMDLAIDTGMSTSTSVPNSSSVHTMASSSSSIISPPTTSTSTRSELVSSTSRPIGMPGTTSSDKVVVCMRIKPTHSPFASIAYEISPTSLSLSEDHPKVKQRGGKAGREDGYTYTFDKLLQQPSTTPELYFDKVAPLVEKAMNGFNSTIFAYGQTGSGKSFTMTGVPEELGIIPCAVDGVFDAITADPERAFLLRVSYIEIYNETLRDLLNFKKGPLKDDEKPAIHYSKGKVYVDPLKEEIVSTPQDVMDLLERGNAGRRIGATDWNERSSRSHCVFTVVIESRPRDGDGDEDIRLSRLNLIDLAGSEKAVSDSERRGEGKHINQSLLALREVINKLTEKGKATHIPYRNSKLTHLLENALGGDSNICVICTISAEEEHCGETLETLKFAGRCSQVKTNAKKNVLLSSERALIKAKDQEIDELRRRLEGMTGSQPAQSLEPAIDQITDLAESLAAMEARKAKLKAQLSKLNGEILTSELPRSNSGLPLSPPKPKRRRISDFSAMIASGPGRTGLGLGTPKKIVDRRAISGMSRLPEEGDEMAGIMGTLEQAADGNLAKTFDQDRALAALRRSLATKEEELSLANRNLASALSRASQLSDRDSKISALQAELRAALDCQASLKSEIQQTESILRGENVQLRSTLQHTESDLRDQTAQLENTRLDLVSTIEDQTKKIDELENKVIDLRNSREELIMEDQSRLDEVQKRAEEAEKENVEMKTRLEHAADAERKKAEEADKIREELVALQAQHADRKADLQAVSSRAEDHERSITALRAQIHELATAKEVMVTTLQGEKAAIEQQRDEARSDLDRFQREAMQNEAGILAELRGEIGNLRKSRDEDRKKWEAEKAEMERAFQEERDKASTIESTIQSELERAQTVIREFEGRESKQKDRLDDAMRTLNDAAQANSKLEEKLRIETDAKSTSQDKQSEVEKKLTEALQSLAEATGTSASLETQLRAEAEAKQALVSERDEARARLTTADGAAQQLEVVISARSALEVKMADVRRQLSDHQDTQDNLQVQLSSARAELQAQLSSAQEDLEVQEKRLEAESNKRKDAEKKIEILVSLRDEALSAVKEKDELLNREKETREKAEKQALDLVAQREANLAGIKEMRRKLDLEVSARREAEGQVETLKAQQEITRTGESELQERLHTVESTLKDLEGRYADLTKEKEQLAADLTNTKKSLEEARIGRQDALDQLEVASTKASEESSEVLRAETAARKAAEEHILKVTRELISKHDSAQRVLEDELFSLRETLTATKAELREALDEVERQRERGDKLSAELVDLRTKSEVTITTSISSRLRQSAPGPGDAENKEVATAVKEDLKRRIRRGHSTGTGPGGIDRDDSLVMLAQRDDDVIDRLEKIIEAQKEIIDEQREKIERWAKEMDKQREIVRLLTNDTSGPSSSHNMSPVPPCTESPRGHMKSHSISHSPVLPPSPLPLSKGIVPSFTARNLALPTTPSPLPMHPSQFGNSLSRKSRRVTIEHDIDRLAESSKVLKAKAIFESPEKNGQPPYSVSNSSSIPGTPPRAPLRAAQAIRSVPVQRRP